MTSILVLAAILAIGTMSLDAFRTQLMNVIVAEQNVLMVRIAEDLDNKLLQLQRAVSRTAKAVKRTEQSTP